MRRAAILLAVILSCCAPTICSAQQDQVFGKKGTPTNGRISSITPDKITIQGLRGAQDVETKDILKVVFADEPDALTTARERATDRQFTDAVDELKKIDMTAITDPRITQEATYYAAFCMAQLALTAGGDKAAATQKMFDFLSQNQASYHFYEGAELLGDLYYAQGNYGDAAKFYGVLVKAPWVEYKMKATVLKARALAGEGKDEEAIAAYDTVIGAGVNTLEATEQKMHATVGKAVSLAATGKHDEGVKLVESLIAKNDPSDAALFGRAYNALGACYEKAGKPKDALLAYLHTDRLFYMDGDAHAEALYHLSKLWPQVNRSDRAGKASTTLRSRYPGSPWAAKE